MTARLTLTELAALSDAAVCILGMWTSVRPERLATAEAAELFRAVTKIGEHLKAPWPTA